jgi:hypothetical protein
MLKKMSWATFWAIFKKSSSGHPANEFRQNAEHLFWGLHFPRTVGRLNLA